MTCHAKYLARAQIWVLHTILEIEHLPLLCMNATTVYHNFRPIEPDDESIGIGNRASACISHCIYDFIGDMVETNRAIIGYNNSKTNNLLMGPLRWKWTDDQGLEHTHTIPQSYYSPEGKCRLLSPQHWAQHQKDKAISITTKSEIILEWGNGKYRKTVPLGKNDNVATMYSSPGYSKFHAFVAKADITDDHDEQPILCQKVTSIIEDEDDDHFDYDGSGNKTSPIPIATDNVDDEEKSEIAAQLEIQ